MQKVTENMNSKNKQKVLSKKKRNIKNTTKEIFFVCLQLKRNVM